MNAVDGIEGWGLELDERAKGLGGRTQNSSLAGYRCNDMHCPLYASYGIAPHPGVAETIRTHDLVAYIRKWLPPDGCTLFLLGDLEERGAVTHTYYLLRGLSDTVFLKKIERLHSHARLVPVRSDEMPIHLLGDYPP